MKKYLLLMAALLAGHSAMAYLSSDGTKLANGGGRCAVCAEGWVLQSNGRYTCSGTPTVEQPDCRPAAMSATPPHGGMSTDALGSGRGGFNINGQPLTLQVPAPSDRADLMTPEAPAGAAARAARAARGPASASKP